MCAVSYATVSRAARRLAADVPVLFELATLGDILATTATAGAAAGREREAGRLVASMRARIDAAALAACGPAAENLLNRPPAVAADPRLQVGGDRAGVVDAVAD